MPLLFTMAAGAHLSTSLITNKCSFNEIWLQELHFVGHSQQGSSSKRVVMDAKQILKVDNDKNQPKCHYETVIFVTLTMLLTVFMGSVIIPANLVLIAINDMSA